MQLINFILSRSRTQKLCLFSNWPVKPNCETVGIKKNPESRGFIVDHAINHDNPRIQTACMFIKTTMLLLSYNTGVACLVVSDVSDGGSQLHCCRRTIIPPAIARIFMNNLMIMGENELPRFLTK